MMLEKDDGFRALLLMAALVLFAAVALVAASSCNATDRWPLTPIPGWQETLESALPTPTELPLLLPSATATSAPLPAPSPLLETGTPSELPTVVALSTATATQTPVPPAPSPTPTPARFNLREDLPALSLRDWPRPANDNGWGMHFLVNPYPSEEEIDRNIQRLLDLRIRWALVLYGDEIQLRKLAPRFRDAGIMVVWRKYLRPYERYYEWGRDIAILQEFGLPPYMQLYNEPAVPAEWDGKPIDQALFLENLMDACEDVYNAGGYVGLQFVSEDWLRAALREIKARQGERLFGRMFFVPHCYGMNHPPDYTEDINAVLSFRIFAMIFQEEIGFVPPMIVGEGGWKWGATDDARFPKVTDELHRDYYVALFNSFRTGILPNGEPLPDYLFAFCPWLIAHKMDDNAFYDSFAGDRVLTIEALKAIPPFTRRFTWGR
jgi:hypothetical protein